MPIAEQKIDAPFVTICRKVLGQVGDIIITIVVVICWFGVGYSNHVAWDSDRALRHSNDGPGRCVTQSDEHRRVKAISGIVAVVAERESEPAIPHNGVKWVR